MLKSVHKVYNEFCEKLQACGEEERMDNIAPDLFHIFIPFLEPFYTAQRELEGDNYTTLNLVCLWNEKLKHCQPSSTDNPQQAFVRHRIQNQNTQYTVLHKVALFL